ncbi:Crp/Fnr family transcriptional regulator [Alsobacter metallidurans]|uniref:Crp/Fnr family transcriptional regulator n=1 Tax=Alsobacter metallidurans TaxID=340221 RepID=A0A917I5F8_9HYPH|nr:Crp/Fnr family transcriptional regulator [Alsobacter metallidurans]GGH13150.1 Crp/Fnr family transcriptional regulator [Alsobacter metallidurans]
MTAEIVRSTLHQKEGAPFSPDELPNLCGRPAVLRQLSPGEELFAPGERSDDIYGIVSGWAYSYRLFDDGRRQINTIELPGSLIGVASAARDGAAVGCACLTRVVYCVYPRATLFGRVMSEPALGLRIVAEVVRQEVLIRERLSDVARRPARERIANFLHELYCRRQITGRMDRPFSIPLTQTHIADALGLTPIHVSRTLREFKRDGVANYVGHDLQIIDAGKLARISTLDESYARWLGGGADAPIAAAEARPAMAARLA